MENKLKVGDKVRYHSQYNGPSEGVITRPHESITGNWWCKWEKGQFAGEELHARAASYELIEPAPTPLEVARKAHNAITEAGLWFDDLARWIITEQESEAAQKLQKRRDDLAKELYDSAYGDSEDSIHYSQRSGITQKAIDRIIELEDQLAAK